MIDTGSLEQELGRYGGQMEARAEAERLLGRYVDISQTPWEFEGTKRISVTATVEGRWNQGTGVLYGVMARVAGSLWSEL